MSTGYRLAPRTPAFGTLSALTPAVLLAGCIGEGSPANADNPTEAGSNRVATVSIEPRMVSLELGATAQLKVTVRTATGAEVTVYTVSWASTNDTVITVDATGKITGVGRGEARITATVETTTGVADVTVEPPKLATVEVTPSSVTIEAGATVALLAVPRSTVGVEVEGCRVWWLSTDERIVDVVIEDDGRQPGDLFGIAKGGPVTVRATAICGTEQADGTAAVTVTPPHIVDVAAGWWHTCALSRAGAAFCWGEGHAGQLGVGAQRWTHPLGTDRLVAYPVIGGLRFRKAGENPQQTGRISAGLLNTCALNNQAQVLCWGSLGRQETNQYGPSPRAIATNVRFASLSSGLTQACGLSTAGAGYCWGWNQAGEGGTGLDGSDEPKPAPVAGGHLFSQMATFEGHTCGVTISGRGYCWGNNFYGVVGDGTVCRAPCRTAPVQVVVRVAPS